MLANNTSTSPVSEMLQAHYIQVSQANAVWGGRGHSIPGVQ